jgi:hypothetical protein
MSSGFQRTSSCTGTLRSAVIHFVPRILLDVLHFFRGSAAESKRATRHRRADARRERAPCPRSSGRAALAFISRPQRALLPSPTSPSPPPSRSRSPSLNSRPPRLPCPRAGRRCHHVHVPSKIEECRSRGGRAQAYLLRRKPKSVRLEVARQNEE